MKYLKLFNEATFYGRYEGESDANIMDGIEDLLTELEDDGVQVRIWRNLYRGRLRKEDLNHIEIEIEWNEKLDYHNTLDKELSAYKRKEMIDKYMYRNNFKLIDTKTFSGCIFLHYKKNI
jgi:hypothetical protein